MMVPFWKTGTARPVISDTIACGRFPFVPRRGIVARRFCARARRLLEPSYPAHEPAGTNRSGIGAPRRGHPVSICCAGGRLRSGVFGLRSSSELRAGPALHRAEPGPRRPAVRLHHCRLLDRLRTVSSPLRPAQRSLRRPAPAGDHRDCLVAANRSDRLCRPGVGRVGVAAGLFAVDAISVRHCSGGILSGLVAGDGRLGSRRREGDRAGDGLDGQPAGRSRRAVFVSRPVFAIRNLDHAALVIGGVRGLLCGAVLALVSQSTGRHAPRECGGAGADRGRPHRPGSGASRCGHSRAGPTDVGQRLGPLFDVRIGRVGG